MNRLAPVLLLVLAFAPDLWAHDVILTRKKERLEGAIIEENDKEVRFYPYFSTFKIITYEVVTIPRNEIVKIEKVEDKLQTFWGRYAKLAADDVKGLLALGKWCDENKLDLEKVQCAATALAVDATNADALAMAGDKAKALAKEDPRINKPLAEREKAYCAMAAKADRKTEYEALKKDLGISAPQVYYERMARSSLQPKGLRQDVKLTLASDKFSGVYTIFVPDGYDPSRPWPLVVGLHGGGPDGADGKGVVGAGKDFMNFIQDSCAERGYIAVCPTARAAPWSAPENDGFFLAVIREVEMLYHIDLNRVYLMGHSMGGYGTWHFGPKYCEQFAAIAPASGGNNNGEKKMANMHTAVYDYHSDDDPRCRVDDSREAAKIMKKTGGMDFIYTEFPNRQHEFPHEVVIDEFDFFDRHRVWVPAGAKNARPGREPRSSFLTPPTPEEAQYFPFPDSAAAETGKPEVAKLMNEIVKGGGNAEKAAQKLAELKDATSVPMLGKALTAQGLAVDDGRASAAWALGEIGNSAATKFLVAGLKDKVQLVRTKSVEALGKLADAKNLPAVQQALKDLAARFGEKTQGKGMDLTDWDALMADLAIYARAIGKFKDAKALADLQEQAMKKMVFASIEVRYDKEVEKGPAGSKREAAEALIDALELIGTPAAAPVLQEMAKGMGDESETAARAKEVAKKVSG